MTVYFLLNSFKIVSFSFGCVQCTVLAFHCVLVVMIYDINVSESIVKLLDLFLKCLPLLLIGSNGNSGRG